MIIVKDYHKNYLHSAYVLSINGEGLRFPRYKNIYKDEYGRRYAYIHNTYYRANVISSCNGAPYYNLSNRWWNASNEDI